uniref:C-type natriuretic peptide n=1 Tax=Anser cygnoides TaxID=8845 RepID=A0A8B9EFT6_ANSCY
MKEPEGCRGGSVTPAGEGTHWGCSAGGRGRPNPRAGSTGRAGAPLWGAGGCPEQSRGASAGAGGGSLGGTQPRSDPKGGTPRGRGASLVKGERSRGTGPREAREARAETRPRAGWARLLQDPPGRRHKGLHKKGLGKGCFGLKLDRIGAMSGLGC